MDLKVEWFPLPWELLQWHVLFLSQSVNYMAPWLGGKLISFNSGGFPPFFLDTWIEMRDFQNPSHALCFSADEFFRLNLQNWLPVTTRAVAVWVKEWYLVFKEPGKCRIPWAGGDPQGAPKPSSWQPGVSGDATTATFPTRSSLLVKPGCEAALQQEKSM